MYENSYIIFPLKMSPIKPKTTIAFTEKDVIKKPTEKEILVKEFLDETTLHGVTHIAKAKGPATTFLWAFITLIMIIACILHSKESVAKFLEYKANTEIHILSKRQLAFPAVTLCNKNPFKKEQFYKFFNAVLSGMKNARANHYHNASLYGPEWLLRAERMYPGHEPFPEILLRNPEYGDLILQSMSEMVEEYGHLYGYTIDNITYSQGDLLLTCLYMQKPCNTSNVEVREFISWLYGKCFKIVPKKDCTRIGPRFGLQLTLNIDQDSYLVTSTYAGVQVEIHSPDTMPFPEDKGIAISPGQAGFIAVKVSKHRKLNGKFGDCFDEEQQEKAQDVFRETHDWVEYGQKNCERTCFQREMIQKCKCADIRFPRQGYSVNFPWRRAPACLLDKLYSFGLVYKSLEVPKNKSSDCYEKVINMFHANNLSCHGEDNCHQPCKETYFDSSISLSDWPSEASTEYVVDGLRNKSKSADKVIKAGIANISKNFLELNVFYTVLSLERITQTISVEVTEMLSDLGSNIGMYLGASLFAIFELFKIFFDTTLLSCKRPNVKKKKTKADKEQIANDAA